MSDQDMKNTLDPIDDQVSDMPPEPLSPESEAEGDMSAGDGQGGASAEILPEQPDYNDEEKGQSQPDYSYGEGEQQPQSNDSYGEGRQQSQPNYSYGEGGQQSQPNYSYGEGEQQSQSNDNYGQGQTQGQGYGSYSESGQNSGWQGSDPRRQVPPPPGYGQGPQPGYGYGAGYGAGPGQNYGNPRPPRKNSNNMATASLVMGILSVVLCCCGGFGIILGAIGIVLAILSRGREPMETSAKAGIGLSVGGIILSIIILVMTFAVIGNDGFRSELYRRGNVDYGNYEDFEHYFEHNGL